MTRSDEVAAGTSGSVLIDTSRAAAIQASGRHITTRDIGAIQDAGMEASGRKAAQQNLESPQPLPDRRDPEADDQPDEHDDYDVEETEGETEAETETSQASAEESDEESEEDEYVAGPGLRASTATQAAPAPPRATMTMTANGTAADPTGPPSNDPNARYSTAYVAAWKGQYDFHHKGKGRWAAGLPPPGAMAQTGVQGPNKETWQASNTKKGR